MSFQAIIDNAASISIKRRPVVASTVARDGTVRSVSRGGAVWRFEVQLPDGPRWTDARELITLVEALGEITEDTVQFNNPGLDWMFKYLGDQTVDSDANGQADILGGTVSVSLPTSGPLNVLTIQGGVTISSGYLFRAGDIIQMTDTTVVGKVYTVAQDVAWNDTTITLHRPLTNEPEYFSGFGDPYLLVGKECQFTIKCIQFPNWSLFARDQVAWDGPFVFMEVM